MYFSLGLGLGFITTDCTGYATSRLSDDSRRTLNSYMYLVQTKQGAAQLARKGGRASKDNEKLSRGSRTPGPNDTTQRHQTAKGTKGGFTY